MNAVAKTASAELADYRNLLDSEVNVTLRNGSFWACVLGYICSAAIAALQFGGLARDMEAPILWAFICGTYALGAHLLARANLVSGWLTYAVMLGFVSLPGVIYVLGYFLLPAGTATYITGPPSYLYFAVVILSGFAFDARLSTLAGLVGAIEYALAVWLGRAGIASISSADPLLTQDLISMPIYGFKALLLFFSGIFVGTLATTARRLLGRILTEEREKSAISGLFGQYVSAEVKDRIISEKAGRVGETCDVALLFCDIRGFTSFSEGQQPRDVVMQLNEYFDRMGEGIARESGTIDKFIGDAIMAYFGGLMQLPDPCDAAFRAAMAMRAALRQLNVERGKRGLTELDNGIGLHFGPVLLGSIGSSHRKNYSVIGDSVNTAARIEGLCGKMGEPLLISAELYARLSPLNQTRCVDLGETAVKGKREAISIYAIREA